MSRMTKYLRQLCQLEQCRLDSTGKPLLNKYGETQYLKARTVKCRHEISTRDIQTSSGSILRSTSVYYLDSPVVVHADDRIDGKVIVSISEHINSRGVNEGYVIYV